MSPDIIMVKLSKTGSMAQTVQWISVLEAAKILGVSRWTINRAVKAGEIRARKVGTRNFRIDASSLV